MTRPSDRPWLKSYPADIPATLKYPDLPLPALLAQAAEEFPEQTALIYYGRRISYRELQELVDRCAAALYALGLRAGDRLALLLPNLPQYPIAFYGALKLGLIVVQLSPLASANELAQLLSDSGAETVVTLRRFYGLIAKAQTQTKLKRIILTDISDYLPPLLKMLYPLQQRLHREHEAAPPKSGEIYQFGELLQRYTKKPPPIAIAPERSVALLQYTGGTTGLPKGVMLTHRNLVANALQLRAWFPRARRGEGTFLAVLPFFHVYGMTVALNVPVSLGATLILVPRFAVKELLRAIKRYRPTIFPGVPTIYVAINNHPHIERYELSSIQECIAGAAPLPLEVKHRFEALSGSHLVEGYGLSEASPVTHCNPFYGPPVEGSIGLPLPDTDAGIADPTSGALLEPGEVGELIIRGPQVMAGYWNRPEETERTLRDGWLHTGDLARMDEKGYFYIVDRMKELINCSGFKVYPRQVEEVLYSHPGVQEAAVVGIPDPYRGESVKAFVVIKVGARLEIPELMDYCREHLAKYEVPREIEFREALPKTLVGKVLKRELRTNSQPGARR